MNLDGSVIDCQKKDLVWIGMSLGLCLVRESSDMEKGDFLQEDKQKEGWLTLAWG